MEPKRIPPGRNEIIQRVAEHMYSGRILNNAHRGDVVEMMVLAALGAGWRFVGLGWHPWDLQRGDGDDRVRIQVKQTAARQLWGTTRNPSVSFGWKPSPPSYFKRDNPGVQIEADGWFCELFVVGIHWALDEAIIDQVDPAQWEFLVIPARDLERGRQSMALAKALERWPAVPWNQIDVSVERALAATRREGEDQSLRQDSGLRRTV